MSEFTETTATVLESTTAPVVAAPSHYLDEQTGELYVHRDMVQVRKPWATEEHISPVEGDIRLGDVESFAAYVKRYGNQIGTTLVCWNGKGLSAILDYHAENGDGLDAQSIGNRAQWVVSFPFVPSLQWKAWTALANGNKLKQRDLIEQLENLSPDIKTPSEADLTGLLRSLRASVNATSEVELDPSGGTKITFHKDATITSTKRVANGEAGEVTLPQSFQIAIPVLKGHVNAEGKPFVYNIDVRIRPNTDDSAHLEFRLSIPLAERILEDAYANRVARAAELLGDEFPILRAAD